MFFYRCCPFGATFSQHWWGRLGGFLLRFWHEVLFLPHAMFLFVDDFLLTQDAQLLPISATILILLCQMFNIPCSWKKCVLHHSLTWIGWAFNFCAGLVSLHPDKSAKMLQLILDLQKHRKVSKKTLERFIGLAMWCTFLFPALRAHLHWLYSDLAIAPATLFSCCPSNWPEVKRCLATDLSFERTPPYTAIPVGGKLVSVKHENVATLADLERLRLTEKRIWMRVRHASSPSRKLSADSVRVLNMLQFWLGYSPPTMSMRPKPICPAFLAADAFAQGSRAGLGGFVSWPNGETQWFSLQLNAVSLQDVGLCRVTSRNI